MPDTAPRHLPDFDPGTSHYVPASDGLRLHVREFGPRAAPATPIVCLPGLSRNGRDFLGLADHFANRAEQPRRVIALDFRGRGLSDRDSNWRNYAVPVETADVAAVLSALGIGRAAFVGTSRGGLVAMVLAASRPELIAATVLNDIGPVLAPDGLAMIRQYLPAWPQPADWDEAVAIQKSLMAPAFGALTEADWAFEAHGRFRRIDGRIVPDHDPAIARTLDALPADQPVPELWPQFAALAERPVMVIRGENSALLTEETVGQMTRRHAGVTAVRVAGQGHAPMLHTAGLAGTIEAFLEAI